MLVFRKFCQRTKRMIPSPSKKITGVFINLEKNIKELGLNLF